MPSQQASPSGQDRAGLIYGIATVVIVALCALATLPFAETGMTDDFSYVHTAKIFAETGHIVYNGWATAMLGWQILPAALFIKLFGYSYTVVRLSTLICAAMPLAFFMQRSFVRSGITHRNATIATLTVLISPVSMPTITSFLSDCWGVFAIVLCYDACLRALQSKEQRRALAWLCFAALSNAVFGSVRQIAWLGVLVMVPSALWILRQRRRKIAPAVVSCLIGWLFVFACLRWFAHQPYSVALGLKHAGMFKSAHPPHILLRPLFEIPMLLLPIAILFLPQTWRNGRKLRGYLALFCCGLIAIAIALQHRHELVNWGIPFVIQHGSVFSRYGGYAQWPVRGQLPQIMPDPLRIAISGLTLLCVFAVACTGYKKTPPEAPQPSPISRRDLAMLTGPFTICYVILLLPRGLIDQTIDRYVLALVWVAALWLTLCYQAKIQRQFSNWAIAFLAVVAVFTVADVHDSFALYRGVKASTDEAIASGYSRVNIDGGWEYNAETQILVGRYIHQTNANVPEGFTYGAISHLVCPERMSTWNASVFPKITLSFDPNACGGPTGLTPVTIHRWLPPHQIAIYVVKDPEAPIAINR